MTNSVYSRCVLPDRFKERPPSPRVNHHCRECVQFPRGASMFGCPVALKLVTAASGVCMNREARIRRRPVEVDA